MPAVVGSWMIVGWELCLQFAGVAQESCSHWVTSVLGFWPLVVWQERKCIVDKGKGGAKANAADVYSNVCFVFCHRLK